MKVLIGEYRDDDQDREIDVTIDRYDVWSLDHTLAYIIHPALVKLHETKQGAPNVDDEDVPDHLKSTSAPPKKNDWDTDDNWFKRWDWVMDEMIWAFKTKTDIDHDAQFYSGEHDIQFVKSKEYPFYSEMVRGPNDTFKIDMEGLKKHEARIQNGFRLFGKYYQALWD
jgi:hypothetical protein